MTTVVVSALAGAVTACVVNVMPLFDAASVTVPVVGTLNMNASPSVYVDDVENGSSLEFM